jgi:hypothetical protein
LEFDGFEPGTAGKFTPIELNATSAFDKEDYYVKFQSKILLASDGKTLLDIDKEF